MDLTIYSTLNINFGGGFERWIKEVTPRLKDRGFNITILTTKAGEKHENAINVVKEHAKVVELNNYDRPLTVPKLGCLRDIISLMRNADVIYFNNAFAGNEIMLNAVRVISGTPVCAGYHGAFPEAGSFLRKKTYRLINRNVSKFFNAHHVLNKERERSLRNWGYKNIYRIPNGVNTIFLKPERKDETFTAIFIGRLTYQKGFDVFANLVKALNRAYGNELRFLIVGDGPLAYTASMLQRTYGNVKWLRRLPERELIKAYQTSHVLVAPSRFEEFSFVSIEAQACGTPVIASDISGPRENILNEITGFLVNPSLENFIKHIVFLKDLWYDSRDQYYTYSQNARKNALNYDWNIIVEKIREMLVEASRL